MPIQVHNGIADNNIMKLHDCSYYNYFAAIGQSSSYRGTFYGKSMKLCTYLN